MPKSGKKAARRGRPAVGNITVGHLVRSLQNIESWCSALRDILGTLNPAMPLPVTKAQSDAILKGRINRVQAGCPPPLRVVTGCPPPLRVATGCPPPQRVAAGCPPPHRD